MPLDRLPDAGSGGGFTVHLTQQIHVEGRKGQDDETNAHRIADISQARLVSALEQLAQSMGMAA